MLSSSRKISYSCERDGNARQRIGIRTLKETNLGVVQTLFEPILKHRDKRDVKPVPGHWQSVKTNRTNLFQPNKYL